MGCLLLFGRRHPSFPRRRGNDGMVDGFLFRSVS